LRGIGGVGWLRRREDQRLGRSAAAHSHRCAALVGIDRQAGGAIADRQAPAATGRLVRTAWRCDHPKEALMTKKTPDPQMQGEGNYTAARRHRKSAEDFVESGKVDRAAREAAPENEKQERELRDAEKAGKAHARK
jgi:hypothetical protein